MVDNQFSNKDMESSQKAQNKGALQPGQKAPDFTLKSTPDQEVSLHEYLGKRVVLVFYPEDWSPVCTDQLSLYNELLPEFAKYDAEIMGISIDSAWSHRAFAQSRNLHFPLLADFEPKGAVGHEYGVYREKQGTEERALFVIDEEGIIRWSYVSPTGVNPGAEGILKALEDLQKEKQGGKAGQAASTKESGTRQVSQKDRQESYDQTHKTGR